MPTNLQPLIEAWKTAKTLFDEAKANILAVENSILETLGDELQKGTNHFGELKIVCANGEKWDQLELAVARNAWPDSVPFPFVSEYKPDNKQITYIRNHNPEAFKIIEKALTVSGKKPAFSLKADKGE